MLTGNIPGCIGEVCTIALLGGGIYLLIRRVISIRIPATFIGTVALIAFIHGLTTGDLSEVAYHILAGGVFLGAFFMATDYVTSPVNPKAQIIFGVGCGVITMVIRLFGGYPEGVSCLYDPRWKSIFRQSADRYQTLEMLSEYITII